MGFKYELLSENSVIWGHSQSRSRLRSSAKTRGEQKASARSAALAIVLAPHRSLSALRCTEPPIGTHDAHAIMRQLLENVWRLISLEREMHISEFGSSFLWQPKSHAAFLPACLPACLPASSNSSSRSAPFPSLRRPEDVLCQTIPARDEDHNSSFFPRPLFLPSM